MQKLTYVFTCPLCRKIFRADEPGEPCCTGPSETRDEHDLTVMRLVRTEQRSDRIDVHPGLAERRAHGGLLMPGMEEEIERDAHIIIATR